MDLNDPRLAAGRRWLDRQDKPRTVQISTGSFVPKLGRPALWVTTVTAGRAGSTGRSTLIAVHTLEAKFTSIPEEA